MRHLVAVRTSYSRTTPSTVPTANRCVGWLKWTIGYLRTSSLNAEVEAPSDPSLSEGTEGSRGLSAASTTCGSDVSRDAARDRTSEMTEATAARRTRGGAAIRTACSPISVHSSCGSAAPTTMSAVWYRLAERAAGAPADACGVSREGPPAAVGVVDPLSTTSSSLAASGRPAGAECAAAKSVRMSVARSPRYGRHSVYPRDRRSAAAARCASEGPCSMPRR
mmetsp:Transcript_9005/g.26485  ORF Transcript_9005/g.26485 Transcript_9005/m.26485 type:complete len:222 (-) Transcript_9005:346-1011(-)